jgi:hypothetical protein
MATLYFKNRYDTSDYVAQEPIILNIYDAI